MAVVPYTKALFKRAARDAWCAIMPETPTKTVGKIVVWIVALALIYHYVAAHPKSTALTEWEASTVQAALTAIYGVILLFAVNLLVVAPYQIWKEERDRRVEAETGHSSEYHQAWERATAPERRNPFIAAIEQDFTERNLEAMRKAREPKRDVSLCEGVAYVALSRWGESLERAFTDAPAKFETICDEIVQKARDGKLTIWGRPCETCPSKKVPIDHWDDYRIDVLRTGHHQPQTEYRRDQRQAGRFYDLMVSKAEFEREDWSDARRS